MKKVLMTLAVMIGFSGCFSTTLVECKKPVIVNDKTFCEK